MYHGGNISLEFLGNAGGSVQISQSQSAVVGDGILEPELELELELAPSPDVVGDGPESFGIARGSGQNCASQGNERFRESLGDAGGSDQLDAGDSDQISQFQSAVVELEPELSPVPSPDVVGDGPESLGDAGGSGQNCAKAMKHFVNL